MLNKPSPWRTGVDIEPSKDASFIEYLRWMRVKSNNGTEDSGTILQLFEKIESSDYSETLKRLTKRTQKLAHLSLKVGCPWRIRVGGTKGVESMLLPAFDALGIPYIPSTTLKGIAREMAKQDKNLTDSDIIRIFGDIETESCMGNVTFLDAYPLPGSNKKGGLSVDMANSIWKWNDNSPPQYNTNSNTFLSLLKTIFVIGLRKNSDCTDQDFETVRDLLIKGLTQGIGSRVNSGYGTLKAIDEKLKSKIVPKKTIIKVGFDLEGQLIHGGQKFIGWNLTQNGNNWKPPGKPESEVRPIAFRSMLRYWFRCLALGVLNPSQVKDLEIEIFGDIEPKSNDNQARATTGLFRLETTGKVGQKESTKKESGFVYGKLSIRHNTYSYRLERNKKEALENILQSLTWLMFHLGGIGQGARRPCYKRTDGNPPWRGSNLMPPNSEIKEGDNFWSLPANLSDFQTQFRQQLKTFYQSLASFGNLPINYSHSQLKTVNSSQDWMEAIDKNCSIIICKGNSRNHKPFALSILHSEDFKIEKTRKRNGKEEKYLDYDPQLCGSTRQPSPIWIRQLNYVEGIDYQVVTVFGATSGKRQEFLTKLREQSIQYHPIFPLN
ncbi:RAMP superfamily CRISPR-associated protein [Geminocystis sp. GBBB08]|uniref:RAMP superfamily CRISPR-associated protein n=1 Tax=Geminocystis sp. GBBB08 TaxID=2604140 RepID=UPI0027E2B0F7|nr:RAMP superfamily CRISPR-associated protein [Geminocystis sp. GBBB08]MBL1208381.1 type III-B CRISPR module RAMP protein Cmr6 [Geminocystis sp. GBBB08]